MKETGILYRTLAGTTTFVNAVCTSEIGQRDHQNNQFLIALHLEVSFKPNQVRRTSGCR